MVLSFLFCLILQAPPEQLQLDLGGNVQMELLRLPAGTFQQGSPETEAGREKDETQRQVTLSQPFHLGKFPVTRGQFARFVQETKYRTEAERGTSGGFGWDGQKLVQRKEFTWRNPGFPQTDQDPVTLVTYEDAQAFLAWLSRKTGWVCELPTEAEWEYACRAGTTTPHYGGATEAEAAALAWYRANAGKGTKPVGQLKPNAFGLYDMLGNVQEWCQDWYGPYAAGPVTDPCLRQPPAGEPGRRVLRGGSWLKGPSHLRGAARARNTPGTRNADNGFRVKVSGKRLTQAGEGSAPGAPVEEIQPQPHRAVGGPPHRQEPGIMGTFGGLALGLLVCFGFVGLLIFIMLRSLRARAMAPDVPPTGLRESYQIDRRPDGFLLSWPPLAPGTIIRYRYLVAGVQRMEREGALTVTAGVRQQFVYTGEPPEDVEVIGVEPPASPQPYLEDYRYNQPTARSYPSRTNPQPFTGHPAAY
jgi:formylglycine-generating enzyme required for sulfatase activity